MASANKFTGIFRFISNRTIWLIARQYFYQQLQSRGYYLVLFISVLITLISESNLIKTISTGYVSVMASPFNLPALASGLVFSLYLTFLITGTIARDKEIGTLETLFWAPVSYFEYLFGIILFGFLTVFSLTTFYFVFILLISIFTSLAFTINLVFILLYSILVSLAFIGIGLVAATNSKTTRGSIFIVIFIFGILLILTISELILVTISSEQNLSTMITIRDFLTNINMFLGWISPVQYYFGGISDLISHSWLSFIKYSLLSVAFTGICFVVSVNSLVKRGILQ